MDMCQLCNLAMVERAMCQCTLRSYRCEYPTSRSKAVFASQNGLGRNYSRSLESLVGKSSKIVHVPV